MRLLCAYLYLHVFHAERNMFKQEMFSTKIKVTQEDKFLQ